MTVAVRSQWFSGLGLNPAAPMRLFCFPFAGGGASAFREWRSDAGKELEIVAVALPGREKRATEPPFYDWKPLVRELVDAIPTDRPFALFGHSMGALIGFEVARELERKGCQPKALLVSSFPAPHLPLRITGRRFYDDEQLVQEMRRLGGTSEQLIDKDQGFLPILLRQLRPDFFVVETYEYLHRPTLQCPITAYGGRADADVSEQDLEQWGLHTDGGFCLKMFDGGHFYLNDQRPNLMKSITSNLFGTGNLSCIGSLR